MAKLSERLKLEIPEPSDTFTRNAYAKLIKDIDERVAREEDLDKITSELIVKINEMETEIKNSLSDEHIKTSENYQNSDGSLKSYLSEVKRNLEMLSSKSYKLESDLNNHSYFKGTQDFFGHVKLTDSVTSGEESHEGVGASAKAVKKAYDKAEEALKRGDKVKKDLVASLSPSGLPVKESDSFEIIISKIKDSGLKDINIAVVDVPVEVTKVDGLGFRPDFIIPINKGSDVRKLIGYGIAPKGHPYRADGTIATAESSTIMHRAVRMTQDGFDLINKYDLGYPTNRFLAVGGIPVDEYRL